jgi:hypothetical protein
VADVIISKTKKKNRHLFNILYPEDTESQVFRDVGKHLLTDLTYIALKLNERRFENVNSGRDVKVGWNGSVIGTGKHELFVAHD